MNEHSINCFRGEGYFLSNFSDSFITMDGILYKNAESAFQSYKCVNRSQRQKFASLTPNDAKTLGRKVKLRKDWENIKDEIMTGVIEAKFKQNLSIRMKLIKTGNKTLIEGNTWHDNYWGNCHCDKCKSIEGKNVLGKILMKVRDNYAKNIN